MKSLVGASLIVITAAVFSLFSTIECRAMDNRPGGESEELSAGTGNLTPDFKLRDISNTEVSLSDYKGKQSVLLFFWTTWCPYCVEALSTLNPKYLQLRQEGCEILAVNLGESAEKVSKYVKKYNPLFKVLVNRDKSVAYAFDVLGVPTYILINKEGEIIWQGHRFPEDYKKLISK